MSGKVHVMDHPLVAHKLTILRDKDTSVKDFRELVFLSRMMVSLCATRGWFMMWTFSLYMMLSSVYMKF